MRIQVKKNHPNSILPTRADNGSSGKDAYVANFSRSYHVGSEGGKDISDSGLTTFTLYPKNRVLIDLGVSMSVPIGYEVQVRPRSGLALKSGITIVNTPGTVDASYTGKIQAIVINHGHSPFEIKVGDRICQLVVSPVVMDEWEEVEDLDNTERGTNGFGSTGV